MPLVIQSVSSINVSDSLGLGATQNLCLSTSVGSNALTISLITKAGTAPSISDPVYIPFRSATITSGIYAVAQATAATTLVISSGSTLGMVSAVPGYIFVYAILDSSGVVRLAASRMPFFAYGSPVNATAEGGGGAADSNAVLYAAASHTLRPVCLIGRILITEATAGTWASNATEIAVAPFEFPPLEAVYSTSVSSISNATVTVDCSTKVSDLYNCVTTGANWSFVAPIAGLYTIQTALRFASQTYGSTQVQECYAAIGNVSNFIFSRVSTPASTVGIMLNGSGELVLAQGDSLNVRAYNDTTTALDGSASNRVSIQYRGYNG